MNAFFQSDVDEGDNERSPFMGVGMTNPVDDQVALKFALSELALTNKEIALQVAEQADKAAKSVLATKKLADELIGANKELAHENEVKVKLAAELLAANKELEFQVSQRELQRERILQISLHDSLTKLANRSLLSDRLSLALAANRRSGCYGAILFIDLDNFKALNDTHGHHAGDLLLIEVARRLNACVRLVDTVARLGGDEFVVLITELNQEVALAKTSTMLIAEEIRLSLAQPYIIQTQGEQHKEYEVQHHCTASIGVTLFDAEIGSEDKVLVRADHAMYRAKEAGRNRIVFAEG